MKNIEEIIKKAIDIHVHIGPEIIPRKYVVENLIKKEKGKIAGFVLKNHFYPTVPLVQNIEKKGKPLVFGSVVLNNAIGGLNPEAIYASSLIAKKTFFVWFPTINAENFLNKSSYEIPKEWVGKKEFIARKSKSINGLKIVKGNQLKNETISLLKMIKKVNGVLATGHISWQESLLLAEKALKIGLKKIVITHPIYQRINMPIEIQKKLAKKNCFIEECYSMYLIDKIPIKIIARQIKEIGAQAVILSSDVGQTFSPSPSFALTKFAYLLKKESITNEELYSMLVKNPRKLLGIDYKAKNIL